MKKLCLIFIGVCVFVASRAQTSYGVKGGLNISTLIVDGKMDNPKIGFHTGLFAGIPINNKLSIQPELVYSLQGSKYNQDDSVSTLHLGYLNFPLLLKYSNSSGFYGASGPQVGLLMVANHHDEDDHKYRVHDWLKKADFSWVFGFGYKSLSNLGIDFRYNLGLTNLFKYPVGKQTNQVLQLGVFYEFGSKKERSGTLSK